MIVPCWLDAALPKLLFGIRGSKQKHTILHPKDTLMRQAHSAYTINVCCCHTHSSLWNSIASSKQFVTVHTFVGKSNMHVHTCLSQTVVRVNVTNQIDRIQQPRCVASLKQQTGWQNCSVATNISTAKNSRDFSLSQHQ